MTDEERNNIREEYDIKPEQEAGYVMGDERDYEILSKLKKLETKTLSEEDKRVVALIKTQLIDDWREPLIRTIDELASNRNIKPTRGLYPKYVVGMG